MRSRPSASQCKQMVGQATKNLRELKIWLADLERTAAASDSDDATAAHARQRYEDKKVQLATLMRRLQKATVSSSARSTRRPQR